MPGSWIGYPYYGTSEFYEDIARIAERGVMDMLFFGDTGGTPEDFGGSHEAVVKYGAKWPRHDMTPMIPLMAKAAPGVGFALTMSTTYHHPFHCARVFNALDHVTRGRIAWNAVTSAYKNEAANYGFDVMMDHDERYVRAEEFLKVACALWESVDCLLTPTAPMGAPGIGQATVRIGDEYEDVRLASTRLVRASYEAAGAAIAFG